HRVALDRRVDRAADVEEATDGDGPPAHPGLRLAAGSGAPRGRAAGYRGLPTALRLLRARHLALAEPGRPTLGEGENGHDSEHGRDHDGAGEKGYGDAFSNGSGYQ